MTITAVIMAGGKGERFWPKSRTHLPKQFLNISGSKSMIQQTIARLEKLIDITHIFIVTNELYAELIRAQIPNLPADNIIIEPIGRNTAPCVGLASLIIEEKFPDSTMVVLPSDHIIENDEGFIKILRTAVEVAREKDNLVTLGIQPTYPETGYGYIESTKQIQKVNDLDVHKVNKFVEKPDLETAQSYLDSGNFFWNSGIFIWKTDVIRNYIKQLMPDMHDVLETLKKAFQTDTDRNQLIRNEFYKMPDQSIDYGIMEKVSNIYVIPCVFGWDDVGSWTALDRINDRDENGNVIKGNILNLDTKRCIIESNGKLIATLGIEDLIIVDTEDVTLICTKDKAQEVKLLLKELRTQKLDQYL
ncbi:mannose-1-phosphate guanylyltransferase/mannose-6-phosphate isomerase [Paenibacillus doosanensis]|uniref:mannose-1-phosphate guanylyltransferase/mannose-6-phosphate isomerase n=1 Tax=Paenibacillus doosanensis TaxID=1229154 RepID=UPI00217F4068|nr:mannose-1-phosphate guanylyltransferase/mannose-6-phosphate isomerase [Paenibacillus doosanensis]MCS7464256.1 mannose-1-phosphate guanylyltransferase/mannose-6-phosphate isomerase [Paenibacillus doosanensis]